MPRLFAALEVPRDAAMRLSLLRGGLHKTRWIEPENYHITLRFFGDVEHHVADRIVEALDRVSRPAFQLQLAGVDVFGNKKPHSIYAGVAPSPELRELQSQIETKSQRIGGVPADKRRFTPHVTLARLKGTDNRELGRWVSAHNLFQTMPFKVSRFVLMSSRESVGGGPYVIEESWPLQGAEPARSDRIAKEAIGEGSW